MPASEASARMSPSWTFFLGQQTTFPQPSSELLRDPVANGDQVERSKAPFTHFQKGAMRECLLFTRLPSGCESDFLNGGGRHQQDIAFLLENFSEGMGKIPLASQIHQKITVQSELFLFLPSGHR